MGVPSIKNRVGMTVSGTPGTGTITLSSAETGYQSFASAYGANANVDVLIEDSGAWEIARDCTYTHSGTTLSRGTLEASSTGSALSLTSAAKVYVIDTAERSVQAAMTARGHIEGLGLTYSSTTAIIIEAGNLVVNGKIYSLAQTTYTSGSTMKDLAGNTVTLGASKAYFVYAYNNAGTLEIRFEDRDGTGDGADPTFDTDLDYWKAPSTGANARRIGKVWTNASSQFINFKHYGKGRDRIFQTANYAAVALLNAGASTSYAAITTTPYITSDDDAVIYQATVIGGNSNGSDYFYMSLDGGTTDALQTGASIASTNMNVSTPRIELQNTGTLHYKVINAADAGYLRVCGFRGYV